jgi:hypothetical protein
MGAWCEKTGREINVSLAEMLETTAEARFWIDGFLAGSELPPPDTDSPTREAEWKEARREYRVTGEWPVAPEQ